MTILVTGGAGYIGSHMVYALVDAGEPVAWGGHTFELVGVREATTDRAIVVKADVRVDGGQVYQEKEKILLDRMRYSAGLGLQWISPVGPLKLSYAKPLNAKPGDQLERFQIQMGTGF